MLNAADEKIESGEPSRPDPSGMITATHKGILPIGGLQLECTCWRMDEGASTSGEWQRPWDSNPEGGNAFMKTLRRNPLDPNRR